MELKIEQFMNLCQMGLRPSQKDLNQFENYVKGQVGIGCVNRVIRGLQSSCANEKECNEWKLTDEQWLVSVKKVLENLMSDYIVKNKLK
jgi:hypothetical protein